MSKVAQVFDSWADDGRAHSMEERHGPFARVGFDWLNVQPGERYLDVGCGSGYTVRWAQAAAAKVQAVGIDAAQRMISLSQELSATHPGCEFVCDTFPSTALRERYGVASFDAIFSMEALYYVPDLPAALAEIQALLKPGGRLACAVDYFVEHKDSHSWPERTGLDMQLLTKTQWRTAIEDAGMTVVEQKRATNTLITCATKPTDA